MCTVFNKEKTEKFLAEWGDEEEKTFYKAVCFSLYQTLNQDTGKVSPSGLVSLYQSAYIAKGESFRYIRCFQDWRDKTDIYGGVYHALLDNASAQKLRSYLPSMDKSISIIPIKIKKKDFLGIGEFPDHEGVDCVISTCYSVDPEVYQKALEGEYKCVQS